jgi:hypothetical protein
MGFLSKVTGGIFGGDHESSSSQTFTPAQKEQFDLLLGRAGDIFQGGGFFAADPFGGIDPIAGRTSDQQQLLSDLIGGTGGISRTGLGALQSGLGPYDPNNPALTAAIDAASGDVTRNLQRNILPAVGGAAVNAGAFGGSRQGIAEGLAMSDANQQISDMATNMRLADMQGFQDRQQSLLSNLGGITQGVVGAGLGAGDIERSDRQAEIDVELERFARESGLELANLQAFRDLIMGNMGGTTTGTQTTPGGGLGGLLGAAIGGGFGGLEGATLGSKIGSRIG